MSYAFPPDVQHLIDLQMASGRYPSQNELLREALLALNDFDASVADIQEGMEDERAGRLRSLAEADANIRRELGFAS